MSPVLLMRHRKYTRSLKASAQLHKALDRTESTLGEEDSTAETQEDFSAQIAKIDDAADKQELLKVLVESIRVRADVESQLFKTQMDQIDKDIAEAEQGAEINAAKTLHTSGEAKVMAVFSAVDAKTLTDELVDILARDAGEGYEDMKAANKALRSYLGERLTRARDQERERKQPDTVVAAVSTAPMVDNADLRRTLAQLNARYKPLLLIWQELKTWKYAIMSKKFKELTDTFEKLRRIITNETITPAVQTSIEALKPLLQTAEKKLNDMQIELETPPRALPLSGSAPPLPTRSPLAAIEESVSDSDSDTESDSRTGPTAPLIQAPTWSNRPMARTGEPVTREDVVDRVQKLAEEFAKTNTRLDTLKDRLRQNNVDGDRIRELTKGITEAFDNGAEILQKFNAENDKDAPNLQLLSGQYKGMNGILQRMNRAFATAYEAATKK